MKIILNDCSVIGQFGTVDEFAVYVVNHLKPIFELIFDVKALFYSKQDMYDHKITNEKTLNDLFIEGTGDPVITVLKQFIQKLAFQKPYWDQEIMTDQEIHYEYSAQVEEPNCFTEAIERGTALLSFPNAGYDGQFFACKREKDEVKILNIMDAEDWLHTYLMDGIQNIRYVMEKYPFQRKIHLAEISDRCYALEALLENNLNLEDMQNIIAGVERMLEGITTGRKNRFWDTIRDGIWEFRIDVSCDRIFRMFFLQKKEIIFLNGFIKKSQETPQKEIEKAIRIKKILETEK